MGDMNCNLAPDQLDNNANIVSSIADIYGMHQLIIDPTRCTASSSTLIILFIQIVPTGSFALEYHILA